MHSINLVIVVVFVGFSIQSYSYFLCSSEQLLPFKSSINYSIYLVASYLSIAHSFNQVFLLNTARASFDGLYALYYIEMIVQNYKIMHMVDGFYEETSDVFFRPLQRGKSPLH